MEPPQTRYVTGPHGQIAWQMLGEGPVDLVYLSGQVTHLDLSWELPEIERFRRRLSCFTRLVLFDPLKKTESAETVRSRAGIRVTLRLGCKASVCGEGAVAGGW